MKQMLNKLCTVFLVVVFSLSITLAQKGDQAEVQLKAAIQKQTVDGDLKGAIEQYKKIAQSGNRAVAAKALVHMGECYEKLGDAEARKAYERVVRDYADQKEAAAEARARLGRGSSAARETGIVTRQVWTLPVLTAPVPEQWEVTGSVSPDGRYLSFLDSVPGDLVIRDLRSGENRKLTHSGRARFPRVSPDGKQIAYTLGTRDLRIMGREDGADRAALSADSDHNYVEPFAWSPDGKLLLVRMAGGDQAFRLVLISVADGSKRVLKTFDWRVPDHASFSPDGRYIVYDFRPKEDSRQRDVYVLAMDGSRESRIVEHPADDYALGWTPDGHWILFASDRSGSVDAWAIAVADGKPQGAPELVKKSLGAISPVGFTRSGAFYYGVSIGTRDVYTAAFDPQAGKVAGELARVPQRFMGTNNFPDWSRDGRLAYVSGREGEGFVLCIASRDTGGQRELPLGTGHSFNTLRWSPDGKSISLHGYGDKGEGLFLVDAQTGERKVITREHAGAVGGWSLDGKTVYWVRRFYRDPVRHEGGLLSQILARDLDTGADRELFRWATSGPPGADMVHSPEVSPDGRTLAFAVREGAARLLMLVPTSGGAAREIFRGKVTDFRRVLTWTADGRELLMLRNVVEEGVPTSQAWAISAQGGEPRPLGLAMQALGSLRFRSDGRQIAFHAGSQKSEVWVMENFLPTLSASR